MFYEGLCKILDCLSPLLICAFWKTNELINVDHTVSIVFILLQYYFVCMLSS